MSGVIWLNFLTKTPASGGKRRQKTKCSTSLCCTFPGVHCIFKYICQDVRMLSVRELLCFQILAYTMHFFCSLVQNHEFWTKTLFSETKDKSEKYRYLQKTDREQHEHCHLKFLSSLNPYFFTLNYYFSKRYNTWRTELHVSHPPTLDETFTWVKVPFKGSPAIQYVFPWIKKPYLKKWM